MTLWALCSRVELEDHANVTESEDINIRVFRKKGQALYAAKEEFARRYDEILGDHRFAEHPERERIEVEITNALEGGYSYVLDVTAGDNVVVFMRKVESE